MLDTLYPLCCPILIPLIYFLPTQNIPSCTPHAHLLLIQKQYAGEDASLSCVPVKLKFCTVHVKTGLMKLVLSLL